jgi:3-carboxy-cis,cis-muconate cycloisomerase
VSSVPTFDPGFSTSDLTEVFSIDATVASLLEFEAALALALSDAGVAPRPDAEAIADACRDATLDATEVLASTWVRGTPILALRGAIATGLPESTAQWFHYGATTQDAVDTGLNLQARRGLSTLEGRLIAMAGVLVELTEEFRAQPQIGRTFLQTALPTTFGFRTAGWLGSTLDRIRELRAVKVGLRVQLGGANGTLSVYGARGPAVVAALADRLDLAAPEIAWQADRSPMLSLARALENAARTMAKIATDIALLASSEVSEVKVSSGGSSSMPGKENPIEAVRARAAASACSGAVAMLASSPSIELDRGVGGWHVEWLAIPLAFQTCGAAVEAIGATLDSLRVEAEVMGDRAPEPVSEGIDPQIDAVLSRARSELAG